MFPGSILFEFVFEIHGFDHHVQPLMSFFKQDCLFKLELINERATLTLPINIGKIRNVSDAGLVERSTLVGP